MYLTYRNISVGEMGQEISGKQKRTLKPKRKFILGHPVLLQVFIRGANFPSGIFQRLNQLLPVSGPLKLELERLDNILERLNKLKKS